MKFYNDKNSDFYRIKILRNYLTSICCNNVQTSFFKNGENHNTKNAACCNSYYEFEMFYLNNHYYGDENHFTKQSWRKFVKLKTFL